LPVHTDPDPQAHHALVKGVPDITGEENLAQVDRTAELLTKKAVYAAF
jgi:hypothetical protein